MAYTHVEIKNHKTLNKYLNLLNNLLSQAIAHKRDKLRVVYAKDHFKNLNYIKVEVNDNNYIIYVDNLEKQQFHTNIVTNNGDALTMLLNYNLREEHYKHYGMDETKRFFELMKLAVEDFEAQLDNINMFIDQIEKDIESIYYGDIV